MTYSVEIHEGGMQEATWLVVILRCEGEEVSRRTIFGSFFPRTRAKRHATKLLKDAERGIYWTS